MDSHPKTNRKAAFTGTNAWEFFVRGAAEGTPPRTKGRLKHHRLRQRKTQ